MRDRPIPPSLRARKSLIPESLNMCHMRHSSYCTQCENRIKNAKMKSPSRPHGFAVWICRVDLPCGFAVWICRVDLPCASTLPSLPNVSQLCAERVQSVPVLICRICRICRICSRVSQLLLHTDSADQCGSVRERGSMHASVWH